MKRNHTHTCTQQHLMFYGFWCLCSAMLCWFKHTIKIEIEKKERTMDGNDNTPKTIKATTTKNVEREWAIEIIKSLSKWMFSFKFPNCFRCSLNTHPTRKKGLHSVRVVLLLFSSVLFRIFFFRFKAENMLKLLSLSLKYIANSDGHG